MKTEDYQRVIAWLIGDDTGMSSMVICAHMCGVEPTDAYFAPSDPDDLGRCLRLLEKFPDWKPRIHELAKYGPAWEARVNHWDYLAVMMADEVGIDWSKGNVAHRTYDAMKATEAKP